jgi:hypothetical protein
MKRIVLLWAALAAALATAAFAGTNVNGVYATTLTGLKPAVLNAHWVLTLAQSRTFSIARNKATVVGGKIKVAGSKLTFQDVVGPLACQGNQAVGVYSYTLSGKTLKLKKVKDSCAGRILVLTSSSFTQVK